MIVVVGNIINLILFPVAVFSWGWTQEDPRLVLLGYMSMFLIGWMIATYILFMYKVRKEGFKL
jgi:hypothetical protein